MTPEDLERYGLDADGRHRNGPRSHVRQLTIEQAQEVVDGLAARRTAVAIGRELRISGSTISAIKQGWHWTVREGHVRWPTREVGG